VETILTNYLFGPSLWAQVETVTISALANGALNSIPTHCEIQHINYDGTTIPFQIRVVENIARKTQDFAQRIAQAPTPKGFNPFLPYDTDLYVGELTQHYHCLLNKYNVMNNHILMVTKQFEPQRTPLGPEDFMAALICLQAQEGLVFYNGGPDAGASVEHKHLQMIPYPRSSPTALPETEWFSELSLSKGDVGQVKLQFPHRITRTSYSPDDSTVSKIISRECAEENWRSYQTLLAALNLFPVSDSSANNFLENDGLENHGLIPPHNMLMTREYLWVVPRTRGSFQGLSVNALGFAGTFLVKDEVQRQQLDQIGCLQLLKAISL